MRRPGSEDPYRRERKFLTTKTLKTNGFDTIEIDLVTTGLTDTVYLVTPTGILTVNPWISKQQPCIFAHVAKVAGTWAWMSSAK